MTIIKIGRYLLAAALLLQPGCGQDGKRVLRAYDSMNRKLVVLSGENAKPKNFYEQGVFVIAGGNLGGIAAAITLCRQGRPVVLIEETDRIAGCLSPGDTLSFAENELVDKCGTSKNYRLFYDLIREWYEKKAENPPAALPGTGGGFCYTTDAALDVIKTMFEKFEGEGKLTILLRHKAAKVILYDNRMTAVIAVDLDRKTAALISGWEFIDASKEGDLLRLAGVKNIAGTESRAETNEPHAPERADSLMAMNILACTDKAAFGKKVPGNRAVLDVIQSPQHAAGTPEAGGAPSKGAYTFTVMKEPRRIKPVTLITERDISAEFQKGPRARFYKDSIGVGFHPIIVAGPGGTETAVETKPFQIPLGALLSPDFDNLFAVSGAIGATRVAVSAFTAPQTEWAVGEAAGMAASFCGGMKIKSRALMNSADNIRQLQNVIVKILDMPIYWYDDVKPGDPDFAEAQLKPFNTPGYNEESTTLHYHK